MSHLYTPIVLEHFKNPRNPGELARPTAIVEVTNPVCGDVLKLSIEVKDSTIIAAKFQGQGCVSALACGSCLTELIVGRRVAWAHGLKYMDISEALGGLTPATTHGAQLAADALKSALSQIEVD